MQFDLHEIDEGSIIGDQKENNIDVSDAEEIDFKTPKMKSGRSP